MIPSDVLGKLRPIPEDWSRGAVTVTYPSFESAAAAAQSPGERIPSSLVKRIFGFWFMLPLLSVRTSQGVSAITFKQKGADDRSHSYRGALGATRTRDLLLRKQAL